MARYWVNLGMWDEAEGGVEREAIRKTLEKEFAGKLETTDDGNLVIKTNNLEEAKEFGKKAVGIITAIYPHLEKEETGVRITEQPECPERGKLERFSANYCSVCGTELKSWKDRQIEI